MDFVFGSSSGGGGAGGLSASDSFEGGTATAAAAAAAAAASASHTSSHATSAAHTTGGGGGGGGGPAGLSHENGPILYTEPNRTSAGDDIRSVVIYIFIVTIFLGFFLILPGIRSEKFPTFLCITSSLLVTSIIVVTLFGTTWHQAEAPISAAYKAFSRDRIQGELSVMIGLQSVNITLRAHKYYILHATDGPIIMDNTPILQSEPTTSNLHYSTSSSNRESERAPLDSDHLLRARQPASAPADSFIEAATTTTSTADRGSNLADELLGGRTADGLDTVDTELEVEDVFGDGQNGPSDAPNRARSPRSSVTNAKRRENSAISGRQKRHPQQVAGNQVNNESASSSSSSSSKPKYTVKRVNVDINYNERFYWIEPNQMRAEYHHALERGLPYPILTVVEYLSQDEAGFSWSRQYRLAGYYASILLWLALAVDVLMFCLHCAAPKYGIYTMQVLGLLLLATNLTYFTLVPSGQQQLVIPFEGHSLSFKFGFNFWLVLFGGCVSLLVGTGFVLTDKLFPNFIFTTVLDVDFDSHHGYYKRQKKHILGKWPQDNDSKLNDDNDDAVSTGKGPLAQRPTVPQTFYNKHSKALTPSPPNDAEPNSPSGAASMVGGATSERNPAAEAVPDAAVYFNKVHHQGTGPNEQLRHRTAGHHNQQRSSKLSAHQHLEGSNVPNGRQKTDAKSVIRQAISSSRRKSDSKQQESSVVQMPELFANDHSLAARDSSNSTSPLRTLPTTTTHSDSSRVLGGADNSNKILTKSNQHHNHHHHHQQQRHQHEREQQLSDQIRL